MKRRVPPVSSTYRGQNKAERAAKEAFEQGFITKGGDEREGEEHEAEHFPRPEKKAEFTEKLAELEQLKADLTAAPADPELQAQLAEAEAKKKGTSNA